MSDTHRTKPHFINSWRWEKDPLFDYGESTLRLMKNRNLRHDRKVHKTYVCDGYVQSMVRESPKSYAEIMGRVSKRYAKKAIRRVNRRIGQKEISDQLEDMYVSNREALAQLYLDAQAYNLDEMMSFIESYNEINSQYEEWELERDLCEDHYRYVYGEDPYEDTYFPYSIAV